MSDPLPKTIRPTREESEDAIRTTLLWAGEDPER